MIMMSLIIITLPNTSYTLKNVFTYSLLESRHYIALCRVKPVPYYQFTLMYENLSLIGCVSHQSDILHWYTVLSKSCAIKYTCCILFKDASALLCKNKD